MIYIKKHEKFGRVKNDFSFFHMPLFVYSLLCLLITKLLEDSEL